MGNILPHPLRGGGGKGGDHRPPGQTPEEIRNFHIAGPEILAPLGNAVGLVHRDHGDFPRLNGLQEAVSQQPLRGHINNMVHAHADVLIHQPDLIGGQGAVDIGRRNPGVFQGHDLVPHEGDQGGDHQRDPLHHQGGDLIAKTLAAAGGHDAQNVPARQNAVDQLLLPAPEGRKAEYIPQDLLFCNHFSRFLLAF